MTANNIVNNKRNWVTGSALQISYPVQISVRYCYCTVLEIISSISKLDDNGRAFIARYFHLMFIELSSELLVVI